MANKKDSLGDRMKEFYENRTKQFLPRRTYTIIRIDGKAFHTYTKGLIKPFDLKFMKDMNTTAQYLCENIQGAKLAFVQSDEISILLTDFDNLKTCAWFDGNVQKITSVSASLATAKFNALRIAGFANPVNAWGKDLEDYFSQKLAMFDSRVFTIPNITEVINYFIWRQQDTVRNSISSLAQSMFSHKELHGKNADEMQEMCFQKGVNWNNCHPTCKRGGIIVKEEIELETPFKSVDKCQYSYKRNKWVTKAAPHFTQDCTIFNFIKYFAEEDLEAAYKIGFNHAKACAEYQGNDIVKALKQARDWISNINWD